MGMFDYVNVSMSCPKCGATHDTFQSKDDGCSCDLIEPESLGCFYSYCKCGAWLQFDRPMPEKQPARETPRTREQVEAMGFVFSMKVYDTPPNGMIR